MPNEGTSCPRVANSSGCVCFNGFAIEINTMTSSASSERSLQLNTEFDKARRKSSSYYKSPIMKILIFLLVICVLAIKIKLITATPVPIPQNTDVPSETDPGGYPGWAGVKKMFVFGDSYSRIGYKPGETTTNPSSTNVLGLTAPGIPSSNGPNYIAYLVKKYQKSTVLTYDLAYGGATIARSLVSPPSTDYKTFEEQVDQWFTPYFTSKSTAPIASWGTKETLFVIWLGINDVRLGYETQTYNAKTLIDKYFSQVKKLYDAGARNFVFMTVPDVTRAPQYISMNNATDSARLKTYLEAYNTELLERVVYFKEKYPQVRAFRFDARKVQDDVLDNPASYGLTKINTFCSSYQAYSYNSDWETQYIASCEVSVREYYWLDKVHPTSTVHDQWALRMSNMLINSQ